MDVPPWNLPKAKAVDYASKKHVVDRADDRKVA
jgi:hypothetical protein